MRARGSCVVVVLCASTWACAQSLTFSNQTVAAGAAYTYETPIDSPDWWAAWMIAGGTIADFNNDAWPDIYMLRGGLAPNVLLINNGDGTFTDQAPAWGMDHTHFSVGAAAGDFNNDGWIDLYVTSHGITDESQVGDHRLYRNNGDNTFTDIAEAAGVNKTTDSLADGFGAAFGDYDLDGDLDLCVVGWYVNEPNRNKLFRNNGDETFTDVTSEAIDYDLDKVSGFSPRFVDTNGDRYPELLIAADFHTSQYFVNNTDGTFTRRTVEAGVGLDSNGMGAAAADFDNDGLIDWYVTSIHHPDLPHIYSGNMLYLNQGDDTFIEVSEERGVNDGAWGWGTDAIDFDHDGWLDIVEVNSEFGALPDEQEYLFINQGDAHFQEQALDAGFVLYCDARAVGTLDYDNDGDRDIAVFSYDDGLYLFRNDLAGPGANWLEIALDTSLDHTLAPNGFGTRVECTAAGVQRVRVLDAGANYLGGSELTIHFGLGAAPIVDTLDILWNNGRTTTLQNVDVNQTITIHACPADVNGDTILNILDFVAYQSAFLNQDPTADCDANAVFNILDFVCYQQLFQTGCP